MYGKTGNVLNGKTINRIDKFTDGVPMISSDLAYNSTEGKNERVNATAYVPSYAIVSFDFDLPSTLNEVKVYTMWQDDGRSQISIRAIDAVLSSGDIVSVYTNEVEDYTQHNQKYQNNIFPLAILADSEGAPLATYATSIIINFGKQQNSVVGYAEIEVIGSADYSATLSVESEVEELGTPSPDYGIYPDRVVGTTYEYSAPMEYFYNETEDTRQYISGWRMDFLDSFTKEVTESFSGEFTGDVRSFEFEHKGYSRLTWLFTTEYKVEFSGDNISFGDVESPLWVEEGEVLALTAVPDEGTSFSHWETDVEGMELGSEKVFSFTVNAPASLEAFASASLHVDGGDAGNDETGDGSEEKPFKTIEKAIAVSGEYDDIVVHPCEGGYTLTAEQSLLGGRKLRGR